MNLLDLNGKWRLSFTDPENGREYTIDATVPGNVEIDMQKAGIIDEFYPIDDKNAMRKWDFVECWRYETEFDAPTLEYPDGELELVFEGIDTAGEIYLNGEKLLDVHNMHLTHRISVKGKLLAHKNRLEVRIMGIEKYSRTIAYDDYYIEHNDGFFSQVYTRKARHSWGWDNAPRLLTCGIWRGVYIENTPSEHFSSVYIRTVRIDERFAYVFINWQYESSVNWLYGRRVIVSFSLDEKVEFTYEFDASFTRGIAKCALPRTQVKLWYPLGVGEHPLYDVKLEIVDSERNPVGCTWSTRFGIRTIELIRSRVIDTEDTENPGTFLFKVNGRETFILGTNWKPTEALASRCAERNKLFYPFMRDLNCNMVRIWGGGIYEDKSFFDFCDENGIMVWQDFMLACEWPPRSDDFIAEMKTEAEFVIKKYRNYTSLAIWSGDNECDNMVNPWYPYYPSQNRVTREVFTDALLLYDPYRPYVESSPYRDDRVYEQRKNGLRYNCGKGRYASPEEHLYEEHQTQYFHDELRRLRSCFIGESGPMYINAASDNPHMIAREAARAKRLWDEKLPFDRFHIRFHQDDSFFATWRTSAREHALRMFGRDFTFDELDDAILAINIYCGEVFKDLIEYFRADFPNRTGVIWWSLADMWPILFNYSVIDYEGVPKLPYYYIKASQQSLCLAIIDDAAYKARRLVALNDLPRQVSGRYTVKKALSGEVILSGEFDADENRPTPICELGEVDGMLLIEWECDECKGVNHYLAQKKGLDFETVKQEVAILRTYIG